MHFLVERRRSSICGRGTAVHHRDIVVLEDEPASWLQSRHHLLQCQFACRQMDEYQPGMDQVKGLSRYWIGDNVVALDLNRGLVKRCKLREKAWVDVGDQNMAGCTAALSQPCCDRPTTSADFPALPAWADAGSLQVADRSWVVEYLQAGETLASLRCGILKDVVAHGSLAVWVWISLPRTRRLHTSIFPPHHCKAFGKREQGT
ncbi:MAG TPA: hypothetical protein VFZ02_12005 [Ktedonobacteraceae bacterium]